MSAALPVCLGPDVALSRLYRDHFDELRHYLARKLDCPEAGRDAAQDVFLRLLVRPPAAPIHNPRGFLFRTARNFAIDLLRAGNARPLLVPIEDYEDTLLDPASDPARIAEARQRLHALASVIETLPPKCRGVFFLHRFEGLTQDEIAGRVGISAKMVEKHLARAMLHLRRQWTH
ncbi:MAG: RNA polymerase sigma factor [Candidatus Nitricoxidivorans perseverans]|uniref:RNA polymerase sigma factor n=1 Tax=Candidatus Nitricoxidivorans perseverans TaxID=2975601 RepID=A0AA49FJG7_9PROT|nr:MAG: RNA polymerase sigma factor [Candidatus Nitricoxidivorans perseverans]